MNASHVRRRNTFSSRRISILKSQLYSKLIFFGRFFRHRALRLLTIAAQSGNSHAIEALAEAFCQSQHLRIVASAQQTLIHLEGPKALNVLWAVWATNRYPPLLELLRQKNKPADPD